MNSSAPPPVLVPPAAPARPPRRLLVRRRTPEEQTRAQIRALIGFLLVAGLFFSFFRLARVEGRSMEPTFSHGNLLLVRRHTLIPRPLAVGDVIVFVQDGGYVVKRVAALPGQPYIAWWTVQSDSYGRAHLVPVYQQVPPGRVYVLGDNPEVSDDSRVFGPIPDASIVGKVMNPAPVTGQRVAQQSPPEIGAL